MQCRWHADGWFYPAILREYIGGGVYCVEDDHLMMESVVSHLPHLFVSNRCHNSVYIVPR